MSEPVTYTSFASLSSLDTHSVCALLEKDVLQLKECMDVLHDTVKMQQPSIDSIEDAIQMAKEDAKQAHHQILIADTYQSSYRYVLTVAGSAIVGLGLLLLF